MKETLIILFATVALCLKAQNPCSGTPSSNSVAPASQTVCAGHSAVMALANPYNSSGITYQWQVSAGSASGPYTTVPGATSNTLNTGPTFTFGPFTLTLYINVVITCTNSGQSTNAAGVLYVVPCSSPCSGTPSPVSIVPASHSICEGAAPNLSLSTNFTLTGLNYQWGTSGSPQGPFTSVPGATQSAFSGGTLSTGVYYYNASVTCSNSSASASAAAVVSVTPCHNCFGTPGANSITPLSQTVCAGTGATMALANSYTNLGYAYQWGTSAVSQVGPFSPIAGATLTTYTTAPVSGTQYYNVTITCTASGQSITAAAVVHTSNCATPCNGTPASNSITVPSPTFCAGDAASLSLANSYTQTGISFQWASSAAQGGPYTAIPGATLSNYAGAALSTNTFYQVVISCTNSGQSITLTQSVGVVNCTYCAGAPGPNTVIPLTHTVCEGAVASMSLLNSYTVSGMTYQWQMSQTSAVGPFTNVPGANLPAFTSPTLGMLTYFNVIITCTNSNQSIQVPHTVSVFPCPGQCLGAPAANTIMAVPETLCAGQTVLLSLASSYTETGISYQWEEASSPGGPFTVIPSATQSSLSTGTLSATMYYRLLITCVNSAINTIVSKTVSVSDCSQLPDLDKTGHSLSAFPQPAVNEVTIKWNGATPAASYILDVSGRILLEVQINGPVTRAGLSRLPAGLYVLRVHGSPAAVKLLVERDQ